MTATLADFWIGDLIGEGSFGQVFLGKHKVSDKYVAIKVVDKMSLQKRPFLLDAALTEQRVLLHLRECESVVNLWASFHDNHCLYLVMECATGGDLTHAIQHGMLHDAESWRTKAVPQFGLAILAAMEQIHSKGIIHADLKPGNILITRQGQIQLADFGSAVVLPTTTNQNSPMKVQASAMQLRGTAEYSCPEIIRGMKDLSVSADLWSFGCILFAMLIGESPFHADSDALVVARIKSFTALYRKSDDAVEQSGKTTPTFTSLKTDWKFLILSLLHPDPSQRVGWQDFSDFSLSHDEVQVLVYKAIRGREIWSKAALNRVENFVAPEPRWWTNSRNASMRDGSMGWVAFEL